MREEKTMSESTEIAVARPLTPAEVNWKTAQKIANTPFVPSAFKGKPEAVFAAILYGEELGIGPMQSLNSIHVIEGKPGMSPELMRGLVARAGHRIDVKEASGDRVTLWGKRADNDSEATVSWTMEDARLAGLAGRGAWKTYPRAMLLARATSELCRMIFADVVAGLSYTPEEVASINGQVWDEVPADPLGATPAAIQPSPAQPEPDYTQEPNRIMTPVEVAYEFDAEIIDAEIVEPSNQPVPEIATVAQIGKIRALMREWDLDKPGLLAIVEVACGQKVKTVSHLAKADASKVINYMTANKPENLNA
jgi:hypothetical protein